MMNFDEMGSFLSEERRKLGYAQEMVAEIVGVTDKTIRNIEYGMTAPELETVLKLWDLYELSSELLFKFYHRSSEMEEAIRYYREKISRSKGKILVGT